jgi:hypothetical protein
MDIPSSASSVRLQYTRTICWRACSIGTAGGRDGTDGADDTDGLVGFVLVRGADPDDPRSGPPLAAKGNLNA